MRLTDKEKDCLYFAYKHRPGLGSLEPDQWHSFSKRVSRTVKSLNRKGFVYINYFSQFQISNQGEVFAYRNM